VRYAEKGARGQAFEKAPPSYFYREKAMKQPIKVFEPVTNNQIIRLHSRARQIVLPDTELYEMVAGLIGIASITALSKQEAIFLLDNLQGKRKARFPAGPRFENEISGDAANLPSFYHIRDIRLMFQQLGWDKQRIKSWMIKYRKVKDIRSMDRSQARGTYIALKVMVKRARGAAPEKQKRNVDL